MAFRGRGRGRGYGGAGGYGFAKQEPFELFPDIELPNIKSVHKEETLVRESVKLQNFWKASAYYLDETVSKNSRSTEIERYSDMTKPKTTITRDSISQILELKRFPQELIGGSKGQRPSQKKVRWNPESELQKLDYLEKLEQRAQGQENKDEKEKKEGENEDEDENDGEEDIEEEPSDDDYFQVPKKHMLYVPDLYWFVFLVMCDVIIALKTHSGFIHDAMALSS
ncbi:DNA-directed RNA polymerase III subunit RPC7-like isoform X1 [Juglans microcarpa x Juglans regia]|uniref:DNA-directed RNA polymerase III subunit RPC7-like isoform X1 n=1 Tax=Juglans microcarpa x Juglans regia TaxID=2249226 RepID=UPI001B7E9AD3|nr:DNA-directed RNA polymerase III subunit RPC7-like isoform X1 [Juglans microcarpa x Juglans regia]